MDENNGAEFSELIKKRDDLLGKLKKLEGKKATTKENIYNKVRIDYENRLNELDSKVKENVDYARAKITELREGEEDLKFQREACADNIEELRLRFELGEFTEGDYEKTIEGEEAKLKEIDDRLGGVESEIDSMKDLVQEKGEEMEEEVVQPTGEEEIEGIEEEHFDEKPMEEVKEEIQAETEEQLEEEEEEKEPEIGEKELKVEEGVEEEETEVSNEEIPTEETPDEKIPEEDLGVGIQEKEFENAFTDEGEGEEGKEEVEEKEKEEEKKEEGEKTLEDSLEDSLDDLLKESAPPEGEESSSETPEPNIISEGEAVKEETSKLEGYDENGAEINEEDNEEKGDQEGLKCPKCGFLNSKDSWYCEKCGAELLQ